MGRGRGRGRSRTRNLPGAEAGKVKKMTGSGNPAKNPASLYQYRYQTNPDPKTLRQLSVGWIWNLVLDPVQELFVSDSDPGENEKTVK